MSASALDNILETQPQSEPIFGRENDMAQNSAGGYVFQVDNWTRLNRFLILGTEEGTYYVRTRPHTLDNTTAVRACINEDSERAVRIIEDVSTGGRAPRNDQALFALAMCVKFGNPATRAAALQALPKVARTGTHLLTFVRWLRGMGGGMGRSVKRAIGNWYLRPEDATYYQTQDVTYQAIKYRQRNGWTHRDVLRLTHPSPQNAETRELFKWITHPDGYTPSENTPEQLSVFLELQNTATDKEAAALLAAHRFLSWEMVPSQHRTAVVWQALLDRGMPITALLRNLPTLTRLGLLDPMSDNTQQVAARLNNHHALTGGRVHPMSMLIALLTYKAGGSERSKHTWNPTDAIVDSLSDGFYAAFPRTDPVARRVYIGLDVSGSMGYANLLGVPGFTVAAAAAGMASCLIRKTERYIIRGFAGDGTGWGLMSRGTVMRHLEITRTTSVADAVAHTDGMTFGTTNCALPMIDAANENIPVDVFVILTDNETWVGDVHPTNALRDYRNKMNIPAKLVVCGMTSTGFSIADPNDQGMLDVAGFDSSVPALVEEFAGITST